MKTLKIITLTLCVSLFVFSCKKENTPPIFADNQELNDLKSKAIVEDGIMKFRDIQQFHEVIDLYYNDLASLEKAYGYVSYNSKIKQVMDDFDLISSETEVKDFMKENQNYITTRLRNGEMYDEEIVETNINTYLANKDGLFYVGDSAYRIIGEFILSSETKKVNQLMSVTYNNLVKDKNKPYNAKKYITSEIFDISQSLKSTSTYLGGDLEDEGIRSDGQRKVYLRAYASIAESLGAKVYSVNIYVKGYKKNWLTGNWRLYNSNDIWLDGMDPSYDVIVWTEYWGIQYFEVGNIHVYDFTTYTKQLFQEVYYNAGITAPIYFTKVNLKAMTGGSDPAFARIDVVE